MRRIGLTGGIGSGKSTVARLLSELGAHVVDSDTVAREVVEPGSPGLAQLVEAFGGAILALDGSLDRPGLTAAAHATDGWPRLNAIMHPLIGARTLELTARAEAADPGGVLVHDVPLLVELHLAPAYDAVAVVQAPRPLRLERLVGRGMAVAESERRMAMQASDEDRALVATVVLENDGTLEWLTQQVRAAWPVLRGA